MLELTIPIFQRWLNGSNVTVRLDNRIWNRNKLSMQAAKKSVSVLYFPFIGFVSLVFFADSDFQDLKYSGLDQWCRPVPSEWMRQGSDVAGQQTYKFSAPPAQRLTRAVVDWLLLDGHPVSAVEGSGFIQLLGIADPRFVVPSRPYIQQVCFCTSLLVFHIILLCDSDLHS
jgi:hypothetical protein